MVTHLAVVAVVAVLITPTTRWLVLVALVVVVVTVRERQTQGAGEAELVTLWDTQEALGLFALVTGAREDCSILYTCLNSLHLRVR
jgi:hypothetical protein